MPGMEPSPKRRIVKRTVWILAVVVLLPVCYVGSVACLVSAMYAGWIPQALIDSGIPDAYMAPLVWYSEKPDMPGSQAAKSLLGRSADRGKVIHNDDVIKRALQRDAEMRKQKNSK
jgi:hypothetical protein